MVNNLTRLKRKSIIICSREIMDVVEYGQLLLIFKVDTEELFKIENMEITNYLIHHLHFY